MKTELKNDIDHIIRSLLEFGLVVDTNFPVINGNWISWGNFKKVSAILKNLSYKEKYDILNNERNFLFKFLDSAFVQMSYEIDDREILSHRLAFYPAPNFKRYLDTPKEYDEEYYGNSEFHDMFSGHVVSSPIRFDFCSDDSIHVPLLHPYSHCHIGEFQDCRIPVASPISPTDFINFILNNFYKTVTNSFEIKASFIPKFRFPSCITTEERRVIHFSIQ